MANAKQNRLAAAVIILALVNLVLVGFIWLGRPDKRSGPPGDARNFIIHELQLDARQQQQFDTLRKIHFKKMRSDQEKMRILKDSLFGRLSTGMDSTTSTLARSIGELQTAIDRNTFEHFAALRKICTPDQQERFNNIIKDVLHSMGRPPAEHQPPPPRRNGQE